MGTFCTSILNGFGLVHALNFALAVYCCVVTLGSTLRTSLQFFSVHKYIQSVAVSKYIQNILPYLFSKSLYVVGRGKAKIFLGETFLGKTPSTKLFAFSVVLSFPSKECPSSLERKMRWVAISSYFSFQSFCAVLIEVL